MPACFIAKVTRVARSWVQVETSDRPSQASAITPDTYLALSLSLSLENGHNRDMHHAQLGASLEQRMDAHSGSSCSLRRHCWGGGTPSESLSLLSRLSLALRQPDQKKSQIATQPPAMRRRAVQASCLHLVCLWIPFSGAFLPMTVDSLLRNIESRELETYSKISLPFLSCRAATTLPPLGFEMSSRPGSEFRAHEEGKFCDLPGEGTLA